MENYSLDLNPESKVLNSSLYKGLIALLLTFSLLACETEVKRSDEKQEKEKQELPPEGFVYLENDSFKVAGSTFFPKLMNYVVHFRVIENDLILSPSLEYDNPETFDSETKSESDSRLRAHFKAIKKMGFNSLRLVGLNQIKLNDHDFTTYKEAFYGLKRKKMLLTDSTIELMVESLKDIVSIAEEEKLRIMLLLPKPRKNLNYTHRKNKYVITILEAFSNTRTIFSYDFFNEPIYFDNVEQKTSEEVLREKSSAYALVKKWKGQMKKHAPHQLMTISFAEPIEVFEWDPSLLPIDFVSIHTYHPLRVPNEIYWFSKYIDKPWIITETSLPADNDSIAYSDQAIFMKEAFQRTINCGGIGFGWWQYQDVAWGPFEHNYTPLINSNFKKKTELDSNTWILGEFKDAAFVLPKLKMNKTGDCDCHSNYFNMMAYTNYKINGEVVDENNKPIEGAVIRGWNEYWTIGMNTFTNENGEFNLYSNDENVNFEVSAPGYSRVKFFLKKLDYTPSPESLNLQQVNLEYHNNHFQWYLDSAFSDQSVFKFKKGLFDHYKTEGSLGVIKLQRLDLK